MIWETIKIALRSLGTNKMRTFLSMLGIIIGVGAVISIVSIGSGSQHMVTSSIAGLGSNLITITPQATRGSLGQIGSSTDHLFTMELGEAIYNFSPSLATVVPQNQTSGLFIISDANIRATIVGTTSDYQQVNDYYPVTGNFFTDYDLDHETDVIVLGSDLATELYGENDPLGTKVTFFYNNHNYLFTVIGIMEPKETGLFGNVNSNAYIPITTFFSTLSTNRQVNTFVAQALSPQNANAAVNEISYLLTKYLESDEGFAILSQDQILDIISEVTGVLTLMLGGIAAISLLVGGIGIMNIMLVSVTERTREIGIRKALGAKRKNILGQFLIESLALSVVGGMIGVLFGGMGGALVARIGGWPLILTSSTTALAVGFSLIVGVFFGLYPAIKASKLDPVIALSYE